MELTKDWDFDGLMQSSYNWIPLDKANSFVRQLTYYHKILIVSYALSQKA